MPPEYSRFHEEAPHSRLFILASKALNEDDFKKVFEPHGKIEDIFLVKDRATGENKGNFQNDYTYFFTGRPFCCKYYSFCYCSHLRVFFLLPFLLNTLSFFFQSFYGSRDNF